MIGEQKIFWKHWTGVLVLAIIAILVVIFLLNLGSIVDVVQDRLTAYKYQKQLKTLEKLSKDDKYGGQTPEETFDLFISALKKEDIELASKYFVISKQEDWKDSLAQYKRKALLVNFVAELQDNRRNWELLNNNEKTATFRYSYRIETPQVEEPSFGNGKTQKITSPDGKFTSEFIFEKYPKGVWKISVL